MFALNNESTVVDEIRTLLFLDALHSGHQRDVITHEFAKRLEVAQRLTRQAISSRMTVRKSWPAFRFVTSKC